MDVQARWLGAADAAAFLATVQDGVKQTVGEEITAGSAVPYAWGQHFGRYRTGRLARRAGGSFFYTRAMEQVAPGVAGLIAAALPKGPAAVRQAQGAIAGRITQAARPLAPSASNRLRTSLYARVAPRAASFGGVG